MTQHLTHGAFLLLYDILFLFGFSFKGDFTDFLFFSFEYLTLCFAVCLKSKETFAKLLRIAARTAIIIGFVIGLIGIFTCAFVPIQKKYAGILVFILSLIFIALGTYQHYTDDGFVRSDYWIRYIGFVIGLLIGFALSYRLFGQRKWTSS